MSQKMVDCLFTTFQAKAIKQWDRAYDKSTQNSVFGCFVVYIVIVHFKEKNVQELKQTPSDAVTSDRTSLNPCKRYTIYTSVSNTQAFFRPFFHNLYIVYSFPFKKSNVWLRNFLCFPCSLFHDGNYAVINPVNRQCNCKDRNGNEES